MSFLHDDSFLSYATVAGSETDTKDPDKRSKELIENIHRLIEFRTSLIIGIIFTLVYISIMYSIFRNKDKPHIQSRSPILILMITIGVYIDTILKLLIISTDYENIDIKCQMAIAARIVFYYIAFFFILIRIQRVHNVNKLNEELAKGTSSTKDKDTSLSMVHEDSSNKKKSKQNLYKQRKFFRDKLQLARMQREERVITNACVNIIVPLAILGLFANFIPYLLIIIPLEEEDVCWFYFLTRSPYQLVYIQNWLYLTSEYMRYVITFIELIALLYYLWQIRKMKLSQINIAYESQLITLQWFVLTCFNLIAKALQSKFLQQQELIQLIIFIILCTRNFLASAIAYYYSIYLVNKDFKNQSKSNVGDLQKNLGTFAIEDFDVAMKSKLPVNYFRKYLLEHPEHYKVTINIFLSNQRETSIKMSVKENLKVGEIYFTLFQLISIFNHTMCRKVNQKEADQLKMDPKDLIIEIIRLLDKNLDICFP